MYLRERIDCRRFIGGKGLTAVDPLCFDYNEQQSKNLCIDIFIGYCGPRGDTIGTTRLAL